MSLNEPVLNTRLPQIGASEHQADWRRTLARKGYIEHLMRDVRKIRSVIGFSGCLTLSAGVALALACTAWGVQMGVAYPIAVGVGYCMLVCSACLCVALTVIVNTAEKTDRVGERPEPNYAAWKVVRKLRISDASRLWCNIEPGCAASQESLAWAQAMFNAITSGELAVAEGAGKDTNTSWATEIGRDELNRWAASYGHSPRFLQG